MKFDELSTQPCLLPQPNAESCLSTRLPTEEGRLELRPEVAVVAVLGTVQYRTFLIANGVEREVTSGLTYRSAGQNIAVIGAIGGNATGIAEGIVTISVEWQGLEAFGQLQVVVSCDNIGNGLMIVLDHSESMSQPFGFGYGTKLDFAKFLAKQFAGEANITKDVVGLTTFAVSAQVVAPLTDDNVSVATAIMGVGFVPEETDINAGLQTAITALTEAGVDRRVILLITDGQHNDDDEPLALAQQFKSAGGVLIVIGLRDGIEAFMRLEKLANGGFFISAYDEATAADAKTYVSGLKGYLCAGNCCPEGDRFVASGGLNYTGWLNWDVVGVVDLIGNGFYDLIPGHGLYVDLVGSSQPWQGGLTSKATFTFIAGHSYRLTYNLAGNQRADVPGYTVRVIAGSLSNVVRTLNDWRQDFTEYRDTFVGDGTTGKLIFVQDTIPSAAAAESFGNLLDGVQLEDLTAGTLVFADSFGNENLTYVPPSCGTGTVYGQGNGGYGYAYGYCCYGYGCLSEPVKQQNPDPNPPDDIERPGDPFWTSTQSYTASCPAGTTGADVTRAATYKSFVSATDANTKALALARTNAEAALNCVNPPIAGELINLHAVFAAAGLPPFTSPKKGFAAIGLTADDFWNPFLYGEVPLLKSDGSSSQVRLRKCAIAADPGTEAEQTDYEVQLDHPDAMYTLGLAFFVHELTTPKAEGMFFDGLEEGSYEVYVYGHGRAADEPGYYHVRTGHLTGNFGIGFTFHQPSETDYGIKSTSQIDPPAAGNFMETAWAEGVQFVKFTVVVSSGQTGFSLVVKSFLPTSALDSLSVLMGVQIRRVS